MATVSGRPAERQREAPVSQDDDSSPEILPSRPDAGPSVTPDPPSGTPTARGRGVVAAVVVAVNLGIYGVARWVDVPMVLPEPGDGAHHPPAHRRIVSRPWYGRHDGGGGPRGAPPVPTGGLEQAFTVLVLVFVLVSLSAPLSLDTDTATKVVLVLMHLLTAAVTLVGLTRPVRARD